MRTPLTLLSFAAAVLLLPGATAQTAAQVTTTLNGEHPPDHTMVIPDNRRSSMGFQVVVEASGFVCPLGATVNVEAVLTYPADHEWAGASLNPSSAKVALPALNPATGPGRYEASAPLKLEMMWGENRPSTGARVTYDLNTRTALDGCAPSPSFHEAHRSVNASMPDVDPKTAAERCAPDACPMEADASGCALAGGCPSEGNRTPVPAWAALVAALAAIILRRR